MKDTIDEFQFTDRNRILHSWGPQSEYDSRIIVGADGCWFWDAEGRRYLDFTSQAFYANIGHGQQRVIDAICRQANDLVAIYGYGTIAKCRLAEKLLSLFPDSYERVYFGSNGSDAVELALKVARLVTGRQNVIAFFDGYHGASMGATAITAEHRGRLGSGEPVPGTIFAPAPYHYRSPFRGADQAETDRRTVDFVRQMIEQVGPQTIAAVIGEPYVTAGPGVIPGDGYWRLIRELCDEYGIVLISDEMITGFGRSGYWFARDHYDYEPDIVCLGKGLSGGYAPISATVFRGTVVDDLTNVPLPYGLTYAGHALSCAAALAAIEVIEQDELVEQGRDAAQYLSDSISQLQDSHPSIGDTRMLGLFANIELVRDRKSKQQFALGASLEDPDSNSGPGIAVDIGRSVLEKGIVVRSIRDVIKLGPPLTVARDEIDLVTEALDGLLAVLDTRASCRD